MGAMFGAVDEIAFPDFIEEFRQKRSYVTQNHGASPKAILIIPLLGAFLVELLNPVVVQLFLGWFG